MVYKNFYLRIIFSLIIFIIYLFSMQDLNYLFILGMSIYILIIIEIFKYFKKLLFTILFYLFFSFISFYLYIFYNFDLYIFNLLIFVIISFDTFSFFAGILFGKRYIFKLISPNKTLEGYLGGIIMTNTFYIIYSYLSDDYFGKIYYFFLINFIIIFASIGDLLQSYFKRKNLIKQSSAFLPGHGGFFDRFDSFVCSIIFMTLISYLFL